MARTCRRVHLHRHHVRRCARAAGCTSVAQLSAATGAASACGSCLPLLQELCGERPRRSDPSRMSLLVSAAAAALLVTGFAILRPIPLTPSVQEPAWDLL